MPWIEPGISPFSTKAPLILPIYKYKPDLRFQASENLLLANSDYQHVTKEYFGDYQRLRPDLAKLGFDAGFDDFHEEKYSTKDNKELRKAWSDYLVPVGETRARAWIERVEGDWTKSKARQVVEDAEKQTKDGSVGFWMDLHVVVAQKEQ